MTDAPEKGERPNFGSKFRGENLPPQFDETTRNFTDKLFGESRHPKSGLVPFGILV